MKWSCIYHIFLKEQKILLKEVALKKINHFEAIIFQIV